MEAFSDSRLVRSAMTLMVVTMPPISPAFAHFLDDAGRFRHGVANAAQALNRFLDGFTAFFGFASDAPRGVVGLLGEARNRMKRALQFGGAAGSARAASVIFSAFWATPVTDRAICSTEVATRSTSEVRFSVVAPTSSIDDAISLMAVAVESAAAVSSSALRATPSIDCAISSMLAALSFTEVDSASVSMLMVLAEAAISAVAVLAEAPAPSFPSLERPRFGWMRSFLRWMPPSQPAFH